MEYQGPDGVAPHQKDTRLIFNLDSLLRNPAISMSAAEYDYIIVGGGTAGCLVASELATKAPDARILMLEAGANPGPTDKQRIPAHYVASLADDSLNYRYMSAADSRAAGRVIPYPKGRGLGGSSNLNFMAWARGPACDYDEWALRTGDADYAWQNVMQFYRLLESFDPTPPRGLEKYVSVDMADHGTAGFVVKVVTHGLSKTANSNADSAPSPFPRRSSSSKRVASKAIERPLT